MYVSEWAIAQIYSSLVSHSKYNNSWNFNKRNQKKFLAFVKHVCECFAVLYDGIIGLGYCDSATAISTSFFKEFFPLFTKWNLTEAIYNNDFAHYHTIITPSGDLFEVKVLLGFYEKMTTFIYNSQLNFLRSGKFFCHYISSAIIDWNRKKKSWTEPRAKRQSWTLKKGTVHMYI